MLDKFLLFIYLFIYLFNQFFIPFYVVLIILVLFFRISLFQICFLLEQLDQKIYIFLFEKNAMVQKCYFRICNSGHSI